MREVVTQTPWHIFGPWTGYIIGITISAFLIWINKKV